MDTQNTFLPVSSQTLNRIKRFNDIRLSCDGCDLFWVESINGRGSIFRKNPSGQIHNLSGDWDVRGSVGYGGGEFDLGARKLVFAESSGSLMLLDLRDPEHTRAITPAWGSTAAPALSPHEDWVLYVYQQGETDGLALCRTHGLTWPTQLVLGADFYMQPTWHPSEEFIAWCEWNHPYMPWDASCVKIGKLGGMQLRLLEENWVDGGEGTAANQPRFSPDGKWLSYIRRDGNWDSLILYNLKKKQKRVLVPQQGSHLVLPAWVQGMRSYAWSADSRQIYYFRYLHGKTSLWKANLRSGKSTPLDISPVCWAEQIDCAPHENGSDDKVTFLGTTTQAPKQIWQLNDHELSLMVKNKLDNVPEAAISAPQEISFDSAGAGRVYGIYYPPSGQSASGNPAPALILDIHGGPTGADYMCFSSEAAYFTSRGYAYAQINYRGSSGYGYAYQDALKHSWGVVDVEDTLNFTRELVQRGLADPHRLVLKGSSAGGFTALNVLIQKPGLFRAAICSYAVGDLVDDAQHTHKFERFYHRFLTGDFERDYQRFLERSPIFHINQIQDPVALFHGDNDKVVAPTQSVQIYEQLTQRGVPCSLKIYAGEGHGFRKSENLQDYYKRIEEFLKVHLGS